MKDPEDDERQLIAAMRDLAAAMSSREAPPHVERALLAAFRRRAVLRAAIRWGSVAAAAALLIALLMPRRNPPVPTEHARLAPAPAPAVVSPPAAVPEQRAIKPAARRAPARKARTAQPTREEQFLPLLYSDAAESVQVVRVKLPRAALASFGLPVAEEPGQDKIQADVALGEDGIARAVRFVRTNQ